jgi:hypothetical protein
MLLALDDTDVLDADLPESFKKRLKKRNFALLLCSQPGNYRTI